ncbi:MAG: nitroreductase family protein [Gemmatimonadota bacterium]|nr:nitroreductase family protein [Gemmatimonadota bacterium]
MTEPSRGPQIVNGRVPGAPVDAVFLDRWSPRAFSPEPLPESTILSLLEAARWAPSSGNEQPWTYVYATTAEERELFLPLLDKFNRIWVEHAPVIAFVMTRLNWAKTGKPNRHAQFDAGSSWLSLALQARRLGLYAHAMGGFDVDVAHVVLNAPRDEYEIMAAIAIGRYASVSDLDEYNQKRETPSTRKQVSEFAFHGPLPDPVR